MKHQWGEDWKVAKFRLPKLHALIATELHKNGLPKRIGSLCGIGRSAAHNDAEVTCLRCRAAMRTDGHKP